MLFLPDHLPKKLDITFNYPFWGLIVVISLVLATASVLLLYHRLAENRDLTRGQLTVLRMLRFMTLFFTTFLLSAPLVKTIRKITQQPKVILAVDNSLSMTGNAGSGEERENPAELAAEIGGKLSQRFEVVTYTFGERVTRDGELNFREKRTDYSRMLETVYDNHFNENIGALVVVGDGHHNMGENPLTRMEKAVWPVYTMGTGDTTMRKDVRIEVIRVNKTAFTGNRFPVEADIRITGAPREPVRFTVSRNGQSLFEQTIQTGESEFFTTVTLTLDASEKGLQIYQASAGVLPGEQNKNNNTRQFVINVLDNRQKVAILSQGPHPDAGAIKNALEQQINYEVFHFEREPYPSDLNQYNLLIFNQIPSPSQSGRLFFDQIRESRTPVLYIIGTQSFIPQFNQLVTGAELTLRAGDFEEAQPSLSDEFSSFTLSEELKENLNRYPPLKVPFARYTLDPAFQILAFQKIKNIVTPRPLLAVGTFNGRKCGFVFGEGLWRWRIYNYTLSERHDEFNELIDKIVQFIALRSNEDNFMVNYTPVYAETDHVTMTAEVYNEAYEMISSPEVVMTVTDSTGRAFDYTFDRTSTFYRLDAGILPPGRYRLQAQTELGGKSFTESGHFAVMPVNLEQADYRADHRLLYQLSAETGGRFFLSKETEALTNAVLMDATIQPVNYFQTMLNEILNLRWIFFILLALLAAEWFLRKFWGIY